jgi:hypothetical protein
MCYNLIDTVGGIKVLDLKHFELVDDKPFFIFMNNDDANINVLYIEKGADIAPVLNHINIDYTVTDIIYYE